MNNAIKAFKLNLASKILIFVYVIFLLWWAYLQLLGTRAAPINYWFSLSYGLIPLFGGLRATLNYSKWKVSNKSMAKAVLFLALGLVTWGIGQMIWSYFNLVYDVEVPYPSIADAAFLMSPPLWILSIILLVRGFGLKVTVKNTTLSILLISVPLLVMLVSYYLLFSVVKGDIFSPNYSKVKLFFDIYYPVWDLIILTFILIVDALAIGFIKDKYLIPFTVISLGFVFNFFADLGLAYQTSSGAFFNGGMVDLLYATAVFLLTLGANTLNEEEESITIQSILLRQREEELREANLKLKERDQMLSRINQQMYKKNLELIEEKRKAEALFYNIAEAAIVSNKEGLITLFNRSAQNLTDRQEAYALGKPIKDVLELSDSKTNKVTGDSLLKLLEDQQGVKLTGLTLIRPDGKERYVNLTASKVVVEDDLFLVVIISDVTDEIKTERAREEFISIASHELRTPMTIIKNYLWMLQNRKGGELTPKQDEYLVKAVSGTERMIKLIHDMLDVSRMEQGKLELHIKSVDLFALISEISSDFKIKAEQKGIQMNIAVSSDLPKVVADEDKLREVIVNLIGNAVKYTDQGFVRIVGEEEGESVKVQVADSGKGFSQEDLPKLFSKFGRLDNSYVTVAESGGTGLGLYIVKSIVEAMGGKVGAFSDGIGKGATFFFSLKKV